MNLLLLGRNCEVDWILVNCFFLYFICKSNNVRGERRYLTRLVVCDGESCMREKISFSLSLLTYNPSGGGSSSGGYQTNLFFVV